MREENIKCDICGKKLGVEITPMPNAVDYWECVPVEAKHGNSLYAVLTSPPSVYQICDDCFQDTLHEIQAKRMQRVNEVMRKVSKTNCCVDHVAAGTKCDHG